MRKGTYLAAAVSSFSYPLLLVPCKFQRSSEKFFLITDDFSSHLMQCPLCNVRTVTRRKKGLSPFTVIDAKINFTC
jgi:hypothetical protein